MENIYQPVPYRDFFSQLARLAIPVALQSMLMSLLAIIDVLMVGRLGQEAIGAVGLVGKIYFLALVVIGSMAMSCSVLMAQYWGSRNAVKCRAVMALTLSVGLALLVPVTLLVVVSATWILSAMVVDARVVNLGLDYLIWSAPVILLTHAVVVYEGGLRSLGQPVAPLVVSGFAVLFNVGLNYALIGGHWGAPQMGVAGAALGTDIARLLQLAMLLSYLHGRRHPLCLGSADFKLTVWRSFARRYLDLLLPATLNVLLFSVGTVFYHLIAAKMGTAPLAALSLIVPIETLFQALFIGVSSACAVMIGHRLGRNAFAEAKHLANICLVGGPCTAFILGIVLIFVREPMLGLFDHLEQYTFDLARSLYLIMALTFWVKVFNFILAYSILRSGGENRFCLRNDFISMWMLGLPITALAAFVFNADYPVVYSLALVEEVAKAVFAYRRVRKGHWLQNLARDHAEAEPVSV